MAKRTWIAWFAIMAVLALMVATVGGGRAAAAGEPDWDGDGAIASDCDKLDPAQHPGAVDIPDLAFEDLNCDGIDGDPDEALFVAPAGSDANVGTSNAPFQTIQRAIGEASTTGPKSIYIATGIYNQRLQLGDNADGIHLYGGYAAGTWARTTATATTVNGSPDAMTLERAVDVLAQLVTFNGTNGGGDRSAYGVRVLSGAELALIRSRATAGEGAAGTDGGNDGTPAKAATGDPGKTQVVPQGQGGSPCDYAGAGGSSSQPGNGHDGGAGGAGGEETNDGENGQAGSEGGGGSPGGDGGPGGTDTAGDANNLATTENGKTGGTGTAGAVGANGSGGAGDLGAAGTSWVGREGTDGGTGGVGYGGGGGGGGAGDGAFSEWSSGAGGGQGGDGGAGGGRGTRGSWGGGSFGAYVRDAQVAAVDGATLQAGAGGRGGHGGSGAAGGAGGDGGPGGTPFNCSGNKEGGFGGNGGPGGQGGPGGSGGGGSGGPSFGVARFGTSAATVDGDSAASGGSGGTGPGAAGEGGNGQSGDVMPAGGPVTDFDGDGITDRGDACVATPRGTDANGDGCPDRAAKLPDGDGDGVPNDGRDKCPSAKATTDANFDGCTDTVATVTPSPSATAAPSTSTSTPPVVTPPKPPGPATPSVEIVNATLSSAYDRFKRYTVYKRLTLRGVPSGAKVTVTCKGKRCPAKRFTSRRKGTIKLRKFTKKKLRVGTRLTIRVTKPGAIGKQFVITIRKGAPKIKITQIA